MVNEGSERDPASFLRLIPYWGNSARMVAHLYRGSGASREEVDNSVFCQASEDWWVTIAAATRARESEGLDDAEWRGLLGLLRARHREHWGAVDSLALDE